MPWLLTEPVLHNVFLTMVAAKRDGLVPLADDERWIRAVDGSGSVTGAAMWGSPGTLLLGEVSEPVAHAIAEFVAAGPLPVTSAVATTPVSGSFAARYAEAAEATASPEGRSRIFCLDAEPVPPLAVAGQARPATVADRDLLIAWADAFTAEADPQRGPVDTSVPIDARLKHGDDLLWLWENGGTPVSVAWITRPLAGMARISGVYTPPERRGRGYASGCVAAASRHAQTVLASRCMLYADLANPTSNGIYQALGYRPVADVREWAFSPAHSASRRRR
jgi:RimJ/RimL family protein N-acetyltransferase